MMQFSEAVMAAIEALNERADELRAFHISEAWNGSPARKAEYEKLRCVIKALLDGVSDPELINGMTASETSATASVLGLVAHVEQEPAPDMEALQARIAELERGVSHWKANHDNIVRKLQLFTQREDLPVDRLPAYQHVIELERQQGVLTEAANAVLDSDGSRGTYDVVELAMSRTRLNAALAAVKPAVCRTCNGHGMVGGFINATNGYDAEPCPDCSTVKPAGQEGGAL